MAITANFLNAVDSTVYKTISIVEVVLDGGSEYYSNHPISGHSNINPYMTTDINQNPAKIDPRRASSSLGSVGFILIDKDDEITSSMGTESWINKPVKVYSFYEGLTYPTDRVLFFTGRISQCTAKNDGTTWQFVAYEERQEVAKPTFTNITTLKTNIATVGQTTGIEVNDSDQLDASGIIRVNNEQL